MYKATKLIAQAMDDAGLKYRADENEKNSYIIAGFGVDNGPDVRVQFISTDNDNDVAIRLFGLVGIKDEAKKVAVCTVLNQLNAKYRYLKFVLDKDGDVNVEYDLALRTSDEKVGPICCEVFIRMMKIIDEAYPMIMRAMWM